MASDVFASAPQLNERLVALDGVRPGELFALEPSHDDVEHLTGLHLVARNE